MIYPFVRWAAERLDASGGLSLLERIAGTRDTGPGVVRALTYHRVNQPEATPWLDPRLVSATPAGFAAQVDYVAKHYQVIAMPEVLDAFRQGTTLPARAVLITFDDAYTDFAEHAWPVLRRLRLPATLFVPTAYPDHPERGFWWDRLHWAVTSTEAKWIEKAPWGRLPLGTAAERSRALRRLRLVLKSIDHSRAMQWVDRIWTELKGQAETRKTVLDWDELRQLAAEGVTLGAHTQTHPLLTRVPPEALGREIAGSLDDLRREIGDVAPTFAYPSGGFDDSVVEAMRAAGVALAFTTEGGVLHVREADPLRLRRTKVTAKTTLPLYRLRMLRPVAHLAG